MNSGDFDSPFHDSEVEALEESIRLHPAQGFKVPMWTVRCPGCQRGVRQAMLEIPHWREGGKPVCSSCRRRDAQWYVSPEQRAARLRDREKRRELGITPRPGGSPE